MPKTASCSRRSKVLDSKRVGPARKRYDEEDRREPEQDDEVAPPSISDLRGSALLGVRSPTPYSISAGPSTCVAAFVRTVRLRATRYCMVPRVLERATRLRGCNFS